MSILEPLLFTESTYSATLPCSKEWTHFELLGAVPDPWEDLESRTPKTVPSYYRRIIPRNPRRGIYFLDPPWSLGWIIDSFMTAKHVSRNVIRLHSTLPCLLILQPALCHGEEPSCGSFSVALPATAWASAAVA